MGLRRHSEPCVQILEDECVPDEHGAAAFHISVQKGGGPLSSSALPTVSGGQSVTDRSTADRLFDTAAALFWKKGFTATTTREIASRLGIQQASLYYHVSSKEDLLYQLCVSSLRRLYAEVDTAVGKVRTPLDRVQALIRTHLTALLHAQMRHVTMLTELRALSDAHHSEVLALRDRYGQMARAVLERAQEAKAIRTDIPAKYLALALLNMLNWPVLWFRREQALGAVELAELVTPIYLHGVSTRQARGSLAMPATWNTRKRTLRKSGKSEAARKPTSERLLKSAAELFSKKGYAATSTREIATLLGIQKASLYYHIGTKEDLLYAISESSLQCIRRDVETALENIGKPGERITALIRAHVESMIRDQNEHAVTLSEMHLLSAKRRRKVNLLRDEYEGLVRKVLQEAQKARAVRPDIPAKYLCLSLLGLMNRAVVWYRGSGPLSPDQLAGLVAAVFLTGAASD
jgi:AcrR family transcriptional regulator